MRGGRRDSSEWGPAVHGGPLRSFREHRLAVVAGRISDADKERVRDASRIEPVIGDYVALRRAGGGNLKGLCPFHEEKTPSFQVSPARGTYHCFGCGEGGDVFEFVMKIEHLTFVEAVQRLADRAGITLTLVEGGTSTRSERGTRSRLIAITKAAAEFYAAELTTDEAAPGPGVPCRARFRPGRGRALRLRVRPVRLGLAGEALDCARVSTSRR